VGVWAIYLLVDGVQEYKSPGYFCPASGILAIPLVGFGLQVVIWLYLGIKTFSANIPKR